MALPLVGGVLAIARFMWRPIAGALGSLPWKAVVSKVLPMVGLHLVVSLLLMPFVRDLLRLGIKIAIFGGVLYFFYYFVMEYVLLVYSQLVEIVPSANSTYVGAVFEFMRLTDHLIPWPAAGALVMWIVSFWMWVFVWQLGAWVVAKASQFLTWFFV